MYRGHLEERANLVLAFDFLMSPKLRLTLFWSLISILALIWLWWGLHVPIDCRSSVLNRILHYAMPCTPTLLVLFSFLLKYGYEILVLRLWLVLGSLPASGLIFMGFLGGYPLDTSGYALDFVLIQDIPWENARVRAYSASEDMFGRGVVVRKEHNLIGPFYTYRTLCAIYELKDLSMTLAEDQRSILIRGQVLGQDSLTVAPL
jgi:hypothetical protein